MSIGPASPTPFSPGAAQGPQAALRVSDAEREQVVEMLQQAYTEGRLDRAELDERMDTAFAAKTRGELVGVLHGLPTAPGSAGASTQAGPSVTGTPGVAPTSLERSWGMAAHGLGIVTFCLGPVLVATTKGRSSCYIRQQAWEAANFQLTALGAFITLGLLTAVTLGLAGLFFPILGVLWLALAGVGALSSAAGSRFRYPWTVRLLGQ